MIPTIDQQLRQTRATLERTIKPEVAGAFASEMLRRVLGDLRRIEGSWDKAVPFMQWDIEQLQSILGDAGQSPSSEVLSNAQAGVMDGELLSTAQQRLRTELARITPAIVEQRAEDPALYERFLGYFADRLTRDPSAKRHVIPDWSSNGAG
jgi:hypothetical protein